MRPPGRLTSRPKVLFRLWVETCRLCTKQSKDSPNRQDPLTEAVHLRRPQKIQTKESTMNRYQFSRNLSSLACACACLVLAACETNQPAGAGMQPNVASAASS